MPEVSDTWLKINYWFLTHKKDLQKWWVIVFLAVDIFFIIFALTNILLYLISIPRESRLIYQMSSQTAAYQEVKEIGKPYDLEIIEVQAIPAGYQNFDIIMKVKNPNTKWAAKEIQYKFLIDGNESEIFESFVLPEEEKFIFGMSVEYISTVGATPNNIEVSIEKVNWQRIKDIRKYPEVRFDIDNIDYGFAAANINVINLTADITNNSIYDFWSAKFNIVLYSGSRIIGVNQSSIEMFKSFEVREIYSRWTNISADITEAVITPNVNILDTENFIE